MECWAGSWGKEVPSEEEEETDRGDGAPLREEVMDESPLPTPSRALRSMMVRGRGWRGWADQGSSWPAHR
jgi:hypothetical protein